MSLPKLEGPLGILLNAAVFAGALATIPVIVLLERGVDEPWIHAVDWAIWSVFLIEYAVEIAFSPNRALYLRRAWLSPIVVILSFPLLPNLLGSVRLARLARFLRFARLAGVTARGVTEIRGVLAGRGLGYVALTTAILIVAGGAGLTMIEPQTSKGGLGDGIWWAIVTASTVGYGDIAPSTLGGRLIAIALMLSGVGLISTLGACITTYFIGQQEGAEIKELRERTARIEKMLVEALKDRLDSSVATRSGERFADPPA